MVDGIQELVNALQTDTYEPSKTYSAEVSRIDDEGTVWVYLEGSTKETPTASTSSEVNQGDAVNVEWRNNKLYIVGNVSNPSAGTIRVTAVEQAAAIATQAAQNAVADASVAHEAATQAQTDAERAQESAVSANNSATSAKVSADTARDQLGIIENVVGVLELIQKHGEYQPTEDEAVVTDKWYFERTGTAPNYEYTVVGSPKSVYHLTPDVAIDSEKTYYTRTGEGTDESPYVYTEVDTPDVADIGTYYEKYYNLVDIDEAVQNYVSSQLVLDSDGLNLKLKGSAVRVLLSPTDGVVLYAPDGTPIGKYGSEAQVGDDENNVKISPGKLAFVENRNEVATLEGDRFRAPEIVTGNIFMRTVNATSDEEVGSLGWVMRSNGHLSLKEIH